MFYIPKTLYLYHKVNPSFFYLTSISTPFNYRKVLLETEKASILPLKSPVCLQIKNLETTMKERLQRQISPLMDHAF